jgi:hypothetical protein
VRWLVFICVIATAGCRPWASGPPWSEGCQPGQPQCAPGAYPPGVYPPVAAPGAAVPFVPPVSAVIIPVSNPEAAWIELVNVVDDYFRIDREHRVQQIGDVLTEGRIETFPQVGSTLFEPQRQDSIDLYEKTLATFQSIRRRATLRVAPDPRGYQIEVTVIKELEDLPRPELSTAGGATFRHDSSVERPVGLVTTERGGTRWFPIGRDVALEQAMLADIRARVGGPAPPVFPPPGFVPQPLTQPLPAVTH